MLIAVYNLVLVLLALLTLGLAGIKIIALLPQLPQLQLLILMLLFAVQILCHHKLNQNVCQESLEHPVWSKQLPPLTAKVRGSNNLNREPRLSRSRESISLTMSTVIPQLDMSSLKIIESSMSSMAHNDNFDS